MLQFLTLIMDLLKSGVQRWLSQQLDRKFIAELGLADAMLMEIITLRWTIRIKATLAIS
jgi:hypothetical protein